MVIMNVKDYLKRLKYTGSLEPTLATLGELSKANKREICYTSLDFFGGPRSVLDLEVIYEKVVTNKCGGICYELNGLFAWLLEQLGFNVTLAEAKFYRGDLKRFGEPYYHCFPVVHFDKDEKYVVDPGFNLIGPLKLGHMELHEETHGVYRCRAVPEKENHVYIERHKKTVLNAKGEILKQGPAPGNTFNGFCNDECRKENSSHWTMLFIICLTPEPFEAFQHQCDNHQDDADGLMRNNIIMHCYCDDNYKLIFGTKYYIKDAVNSVTDRILLEKEVTTDAEVEAMAREIFNYEVRHKVKFFDRS